MEGFSKKNEDEKKGLASLFSKNELKALYKKYLILIGIVEALILAGCWIYQLGYKEYNHFGSVDVPFPWKMYFLIAFLAPIAITFLGGVLVIGFNKYIHGVDYVPGAGESGEAGEEGRFQSFINAIMRIPFMLSLVLLAVGAGIIYRIEDILALLGNLGAVSFKFIAMAGGVILGVGSILWVVYMVLNFKLKQKDMEYRYKGDVMERTGMIFLDDKTVVNPEGRLLGPGGEGNKTVPQLPPSAAEKTPEEETE